eukprot:5533219-Amphidinium_carterae.1
MDHPPLTPSPLFAVLIISIVMARSEKWLQLSVDARDFVSSLLKVMHNRAARTMLPYEKQTNQVTTMQGTK